MDKTMFFRILNSEMELATGCTEPGAVALTGAYAGAELNKRGEVIRRMEVNASTNILKNAMAAGIPGTKYTGMGYASAIGACAAAPEKQLEVINGVSDDVYKAAELLVESGKVVVGHADVPQKLYIEVIAHGDTHTARAVIADLHTNLIALEVDGESVMTAGGSAAGGSDKDVVTPEEIAEFLTLRKIYDFCDKELDPMNDPIDIIRSAVSVNSAICERGLEKDYGLAIGPNLRRNCHDGLMTWDMVTNSMMVTAAGADARMAGLLRGRQLRQRQPGHHRHHAHRGSGQVEGHPRGQDAPRRHHEPSGGHPHQVQVRPPERSVRRHRGGHRLRLRHYLPAGRRL